MTFENKVFWGGLGVLAVCFLMIQWNVATNGTVWFPIGLWFIFLAFHNRITLTLAISALIGLLGAVGLGVVLGLLLFVISLAAFWYAWI